MFGGRMTVHKKFSEEVKADGMILSRLMPGEDLFTSLKKIAQGHGIERGGHPLSHRKLKECGLQKCQAQYRFTGESREYPRG
jgi:hypothetical protein